MNLFYNYLVTYLSIYNIIYVFKYSVLALKTPHILQNGLITNGLSVSVAQGKTPNEPSTSTIGNLFPIKHFASTPHGEQLWRLALPTARLFVPQDLRPTAVEHPAKVIQDY